MTWEELKEKAKELGYYVVEDDGDLSYLGIIEYLVKNVVNISFCDDGLVETNCGDIVAENRTPDQMYQIMLALDLSKKDETKEQELQSRIFDCLKKKEMSWQDFLFFTGSNSSAQCVHAPRKENTYNEPSIGFYEDGTVWVSGAKGSVQMFKKCPYLLMFEMFMQRYNEVNNDNI